VLAFSAQVREFKPGRSCRIFKGEKILSTSSFGGEVKPAVHVVDLRHVKYPYMLRGSRHLGKILGYSFSPIEVPHLAASISHVAKDVEVSGGDSGNF
jgi:hypothetical protein